MEEEKRKISRRLIPLLAHLKSDERLLELRFTNASSEQGGLMNGRSFNIQDEVTIGDISLEVKPPTRWELVPFGVASSYSGFDSSAVSENLQEVLRVCNIFLYFLT